MSQSHHESHPHPYGIRQSHLPYKQGNALTVDQLRRMMTVFDAAYYAKSFVQIAEQFTKAFIKELDLELASNGNAFEDDDDDVDNNQDVDPDEDEDDDNRELRFGAREESPSMSVRSNEHFRFLLASTLITLLNDRFNSQRRLIAPDNTVMSHGFFKPLQRLIALYLVYNLYKHKPIGHHPFLPHFMQIIEHCPKDMGREDDADAAVGDFEDDDDDDDDQDPAALVDEEEDEEDAEREEHKNSSSNNNNTAEVHNNNNSNNNSSNSGQDTTASPNSTSITNASSSEDNGNSNNHKNAPSTVRTRRRRRRRVRSMHELLFADKIDETRLSARFGPLCDKIEAEFMVKLLFNRDIDVISQMSAKTFTAVYCDKLTHNELSGWPELTQIQQIISQRHKKNFMSSPLKTLGLNPILRDFDPNLDLKLAPFALDENVLSDLALNKELGLYATFDPEIVRPPPPFMVPFAKHELRWYFVGEAPSLLWDAHEFKQSDVMHAAETAHDINGGSGVGNVGDGSDLVQKATKQTLSEQQRNVLCAEMASYYTRHRTLQPFVPSSFVPFLCVHNPPIVMQIFVVLNTELTEHMESSSAMHEYLQALCSLNVAENVEIAQNVMDLMRQITAKIAVPTEFIVHFVSHCIQTCQDTKDAFNQTRLVRYIANFVTELLQQRVLAIKDVPVEVEGFCLEFSRVREAQNLFKMLKQSNANEPQEKDS